MWARLRRCGLRARARAAGAGGAAGAPGAVPGAAATTVARGSAVVRYGLTHDTRPRVLYTQYARAPPDGRYSGQAPRGRREPLSDAGLSSRVSVKRHHHRLLFRFSRSRYG